MNNLILMYHYVRDDSKFKALSVDKFRTQVKFLKSKYLLLTLEEMFEYRGRKSTCVLTFDDGLKDGVTNVLPILNDFKVKATFFIPGRILESTSILNVQKRHLLLPKIGAKKLIKELNHLLPRELKIKKDPIFKSDYLDSLDICSMKWILDFTDPDIIDPVLDKVFKKYFSRDNNFFSTLYLDLDDIKTLLNHGMEIGAHGYSHIQLGVSSFVRQLEDVEKGTKIIKSAIGSRPLFFSYPSGSYNPLTIRLLEKYGYAGAVTIKKHKNTFKDNRFELGRFDCVD